MEQVKINIKGREYRFRYSLRSIMAYEQLSGMMSAEVLTATAKVLLSYYACVFAYNDDVLPFEEFIEELDDVTLFREVAAEFETQSRAFNATVKSDDGEEGKKKA